MYTCAVRTPVQRDYLPHLHDEYFTTMTNNTLWVTGLLLITVYRREYYVFYKKINVTPANSFEKKNGEQEKKLVKALFIFSARIHIHYFLATICAGRVSEPPSSTPTEINVEFAKNSRNYDHFRIYIITVDGGKIFIEALSYFFFFFVAPIVKDTST